MTDIEPTHERAGLNKARLIGAALEVGGALVVAATVVCAVVWLFFVSQSAEPLPSAGEFFVAVALAVAGMAVSLLLWGASEMVRKLDALLELAAREAETPAEPGAATTSEGGAGATAIGSETLSELASLMREIRDISMLDERQRAARLEAQGRDLAQRLEGDVATLLREHNWTEARTRVQSARERFPGFKQWDALAAQIESVRAEVETHDVEAATRQVNDLASLGAWDRATDVVRDLLHRHPGSKKANGLAARVSAERDKAEAEERARLMVRAQESANRHEWTEALSLANGIVERFPRSTEADAIRAQLPTLQANAEIQLRQRWEAKFKSLLEQQQYAEALRVARTLIERYPGSPQALALRKQLPKLEQKVASMEAPTG